jgi:Lrp/AsnC family leucine-responsive transcriptional regulator
MDPVDVKILNMLQEDGRKPLSDIAKTVGLSAPSVSERIKKMSKEGIIRRYVAILDEKRVGKELTAFINVSISNPKHIPGFDTKMQEIEDVLECHHVTGQYSYIVKVRVKNPSVLEDLISNKIRSVEGVTSTLTNVVLSSVKEETRLSLDGLLAK